MIITRPNPNWYLELELMNPYILGDLDEPLVEEYRANFKILQQKSLWS